MSACLTAPVAPACSDMAIRLLITDIRAIPVIGIARTRSGVGGGEWYLPLPPDMRKLGLRRCWKVVVSRR